MIIHAIDVIATASSAHISETDGRVVRRSGRLVVRGSSPLDLGHTWPHQASLLSLQLLVVTVWGGASLRRRMVPRSAIENGRICHGVLVSAIHVRRA